MSENNKITRIKKHVAEHRTVYIVGTTCLVVGASVGVAVYATVCRPMNIVSQADNVAITGKNSTVNQAVNKVVVTMVENSTPSKPVRLVGTNQLFTSINDAARKTGHMASMISQNVNGHIPDVKGDVFELLEVVQ